MAGYMDDYSRSQNASAAEADGKLPLTRAVQAVAAEAGITQRHARAILERIGPSEWHHTSKRYNRTDYYDVNEALIAACLEPIEQWLAQNSRTKRIDAAIARGDASTDEGQRIQARIDFRDAECAALAGEYGCSPDDIRNAYYGCYDY